MIGNSSSGLTEAPSFKLPVVNIGDRQKGRVKAKNIIDTSYEIEDIDRGIKNALSIKFANSLKRMKNPYDKFEDGKTSYRIKEKSENLIIDKEEERKNQKRQDKDEDEDQDEQEEKIDKKQKGSVIDVRI